MLIDILFGSPLQDIDRRAALKPWKGQQVSDVWASDDAAAMLFLIGLASSDNPRTLTRRKLTFTTAQCVKVAFPQWKKVFPKDKQIQQSIILVEQWAKGSSNVTFKNLLDAHESTSYVANGVLNLFNRSRSKISRAKYRGASNVAFSTGHLISSIIKITGSTYGQGADSEEAALSAATAIWDITDSYWDDDVDLEFQEEQIAAFQKLKTISADIVRNYYPNSAMIEHMLAPKIIAAW